MLTCQSDLDTCDPENLSTKDIAISQESGVYGPLVLAGCAKLGMFGLVKMKTSVKFNESTRQAADRLISDFRERALELGFTLE